MNTYKTYGTNAKWSVLLLFLLLTWAAFGQGDSIQLPFPIYNPQNPFQVETQSFDLGDPTGLEQNISYDPITGTYIFSETLGNGLDYRNPSFLTLDEYLEFKREKSMSQDWLEIIEEETEENRAF